FRSAPSRPSMPSRAVRSNRASTRRTAAGRKCWRRRPRSGSASVWLRPERCALALYVMHHETPSGKHTGEMVMRTMRNYGLAALAFAVVTLMPVAPVRAADTVVVGTVGSPSANLWPLFIGIDKGFFTAENIKVDLIYIPASANAIQQLAAGSLDMSFSTGLVDPIRAAEQGAALAIARFEIQAPPYALLAKPSIKSLKDLKGKVISVGGPKDITRLYVDRMLAPHGLKSGD